MFASKHLIRISVGIGAAALALATWTTGFAGHVDVRANSEARARALNDFSRLPLAFVENRGQTDARVRFYAQGATRMWFRVRATMRRA